MRGEPGAGGADPDGQLSTEIARHSCQQLRLVAQLPQVPDDGLILTFGVPDEGFILARRVTHTAS